MVYWTLRPARSYLGQEKRKKVKKGSATIWMARPNFMTLIQGQSLYLRKMPDPRVPMAAAGIAKQPQTKLTENH